MWVRSGECCRCGQCCRGSIDDLPEQYDGACPYLKPEVNGERLCAIHNTINTYWSRGCSVWPTVPHHVKDYDKCTFKFEWVEDANADEG